MAGDDEGAFGDALPHAGFVSWRIASTETAPMFSESRAGRRLVVKLVGVEAARREVLLGLDALALGFGEAEAAAVLAGVFFLGSALFVLAEAPQVDDLGHEVLDAISWQPSD